MPAKQEPLIDRHMKWWRACLNTFSKPASLQGAGSYLAGEVREVERKGTMKSLTEIGLLGDVFYLEIETFITKIGGK